MCMLLFGRLLKPRYRCSCFIPHSPPPLLSLIVHDRTDIVRLFHVGASLPQRLVPDAANDHGVRIYVPDGCGDWSERSEATGYSRHQATRNARRLTRPLRPTTSSCSNKNTWPSVRRLSPLWSLRWPTAIARSNRRRLSSPTSLGRFGRLVVAVVHATPLLPITSYAHASVFVQQ